jgi:hypothetical protein
MEQLPLDVQFKSMNVDDFKAYFEHSIDNRCAFPRQYCEKWIKVYGDLLAEGQSLQPDELKNVHLIHDFLINRIETLPKKT